MYARESERNDGAQATGFEHLRIAATAAGARFHTSLNPECVVLPSLPVLLRLGGGRQGSRHKLQAGQR